MGTNANNDNLCPVCEKFPLIEKDEIDKDGNPKKIKICEGDKVYICGKIPSLCRCPNPNIDPEKVDKLHREN